MTPSLNDLAELEQLGREAKVRGDALLSNPQFQPEAMPERTGEDVEAWALRMRAWAAGWRGAAGERPIA